MELEKYRPSMPIEVLHSWADDAQKEIESLRAQLAAANAEVQEPVTSLPFAILDKEMKDLLRFYECATDGEGYDVPRARMKRLAEIGLVRRVTASFYECTTFGLSVINGDFSERPATHGRVPCRMGALPPIERDDGMGRAYIPMPGGWEVQTKGNGSTFRICDTKTGERWAVLDKYLHEPMEQMAMDARAAMEDRNG